MISVHPFNDMTSQSMKKARLRVNLPKNGKVTYMSRAKERTTNISLTVVTIFIITNLPYMVDELMRQEILNSSWYIRRPSSQFLTRLVRCGQSWCSLLRSVLCISIVSNSCINPFIFLLINSGQSDRTLSSKWLIERTRREKR